ncbi:MAG: DNA-3-methyladenine glycosylase family protein [Acidimicrobiia bacterium]
MNRSELLEASSELARRSPAVAKIVAREGPAAIGIGRPRRTHFAELARAICSQQLAVAAARAIHSRFEALYGGSPTAAAVLVTDEASLRGVGLSAAKVAAIRDLATRVTSGSLSLARIGAKPDEDVVGALVQVRGIGRWTAEMFLIFQLGRPDVWPVDDLGVRRGYAILHGRAALPSTRDLDVLGEEFRPYRSVAAWYCWRAVAPSAPV